MNTSKGVMASFLACVAIITYRDFKTPDSSWPLGPVPPPYRYVWSAVVFGILFIASGFVNPKITNVVALGVVVGLLYDTVANPVSGGAIGKKSIAPSYGDTHNPINNGATGSSAMGNSGTVQA